MNSKKARAAVLDMAVKLGAIVRAGPEGYGYVIAVEAPRGTHWSEGDAHELIAEQNSGPWSTAPLWADLYERMLFGLEKCTDDCEWGNPAERAVRPTASGSTRRKSFHEGGGDEER